MLPKLPTLYPRRPLTPFNPHRDALAAYCKSPYRQCSAHLHRHHTSLVCGALSIRHYGFRNSYLGTFMTDDIEMFIV
jgi:hypothetical protein